MPTDHVPVLVGPPVLQRPTNHSPKAKQHTDINLDVNWGKLYGVKQPPIDLYRTNFRFTARVSGQSYDIGAMITNASWSESSNLAFGLGVDPLNMGMVGSITLTKPSLNQYNKLVPDFAKAIVDAKRKTAGWGALGVVVIASAGYGKTYKPIWAMRVQPTDSNIGEEIDLATGAWTWNLADDLLLVGQTMGDWQYTKGKKVRKQGWRAHEIAHDVCVKYKIPVRQLVRGTVWMELATKDTTNVSPLDVISQAYKQEATKTGKTFAVRWGAPDSRHPTGALEVVPLRRNASLLTFRHQLIEAALQRSQSPQFATVVEARGKMKGKSGKTKNLTYTYVSQQAVKRFGWIQKFVDFGSVSSMLELQILAKRYLALNLAPMRTANLTHPGVATVRVGDAIRIDIPEEGYAAVALDALHRPSTPKTSKRYSVKQLIQAEQDDPSMFGLPDPSLQTATGAANTQQTKDTTNATTLNQPIVPQVADQGIAFVTSVEHTVEAGSYRMQIATNFIDVLDPMTVQAHIDATLRTAKGKKGSGASNNPVASGTGVWWEVKASAEDSRSGVGWTELSSNGNGAGIAGHQQSTNCQGNSVGGCDFATLGHAYPHGTQMKIVNPANGRSGTFPLTDVGNGSSFGPAIGLTPTVQNAIGWSGGVVHIQLANGDPMSVVSGFGKQVSGP